MVLPGQSRVSHVNIQIHIAGGLLCRHQDIYYQIPVDGYDLGREDSVHNRTQFFFFSIPLLDSDILRAHEGLLGS